jgi:hypothetical protein
MVDRPDAVTALVECLQRERAPAPHGGTRPIALLDGARSCR